MSISNIIDDFVSEEERNQFIQQVQEKFTRKCQAKEIIRQRKMFPTISNKEKWKTVNSYCDRQWKLQKEEEIAKALEFRHKLKEKEKEKQRGTLQSFMR